MSRTRLSKNQVAPGAIGTGHLGADVAQALLHTGDTEDTSKHIWFKPASGELVVKTTGGWQKVNGELAADSINGLKFRVSNGKLQVSADGGSTWGDV
jgi:hypothetical protein